MRKLLNVTMTQATSQGGTKYIYTYDSNGNPTKGFGIKLNLSELKFGFESSTAIQWDNTTETTYTNVSISGWAIAAAYALLATGQPVQTPSYAYQY